MPLDGDVHMNYYELRRRLLFWLEEYQKFPDPRAISQSRISIGIDEVDEKTRTRS